MFGARLNKLGAPSKQAPFAPTRLFADSEGFYNDIQTYSTSYFTDTAGTDPAELEDTIGLVLDQSGNDIDLTQATAGARPLLTTDGGYPVLQFDQVDDALVATIPAITSGTLVLATRQGIWIDDDINADAGTFSIGPTTYTGGPAGLLSVIGDKLIGPPVLLDRQLTTSEKNALVQWFQNRGAGALYVLGENELTNGDFSDGTTGWVSATTNTADLSEVGGELVVTNTASFGRSVQSRTVIGGNAQAYFFSADVTEVQDGRAAVVGISPNATGGATSIAQTTTSPSTLKGAGTLLNVTQYFVMGASTSGVGGVFKFDNAYFGKITQPGA
jgi:hypothetical protein